MIDQNSQFQAILTAVGEAKQANADALGIPWTFAQMGVGDANGTDPFPNRLQTKLINERRKAPLNQLKPDPKNPGIIIAEQVIPENVGGFWIREIGLYDQDGDLVAVANCAPTFKPLLAQGSGRTQIIRMNLIVSSIANIVLKIDPSVVLATRQYVDETIEVLVPGNKTPGTYRQVTINKYGIVSSGSNPTTLAGYGITDALRVGVVSNQRPVLAGSRPVSADNNVGGTGGALSIREVNEVGSAESHLDYAPSIHFFWLDRFARYLKMSVVGDLIWGNKKVWTEWNFDPGSKANRTEVDTALASKADKATTLGGYGIDDAFTKTQTAAAIQAAVAALVNGAPGALDQLDELARAMGNDPNFATTMINALAQKPDKATTLAGYGIALPTKVQAEAGEDNTLPMTPLRVLQAFTKFFVQASEAVFGGARVANQTQANAGLDDTTIMTPLKTAKAAPSVRGARGNLKVSTTGSSAVISITADQLILQGPSGAASTLKNLNIAVSTAMSGAGGLDAGVIASNSWYSVWVIYNPVNGDLSGLLSTGATPPKLPWAGDIRYSRVGWILTATTADKFPLGMIQLGDRGQWKLGANIPFTRGMASGVQGVATHPPTFVPVSVDPFVPPTARSIACTVHIEAGPAGVIAAPNNAYGGYNSATNLAPLCVTTPGSTPLNMNSSALILLESRSIYYASGSSTGQLVATGWEDNL